MYSPKLNEELVRKLYQLKHSNPDKPPMTKLVNEAVEEYLERRKINAEKKYSENNQSPGSDS